MKILPEIINNFAHSIHMKRLAKKHEYQMANLRYEKIQKAFKEIPINDFVEPRFSMRITANNTFPNIFYDEKLSDMFIELFKKSAHRNYVNTASCLWECFLICRLKMQY